MTTLSPEQIHAAIADLLAQVIEVPPATITPEARFVEDLRVDSLSMLELVLGIQARFGVTVRDADVRGLVRVEDATAYVAAAV